MIVGYESQFVTCIIMYTKEHISLCDSDFLETMTFPAQELKYAVISNTYQNFIQCTCSPLMNTHVLVMYVFNSELVGKGCSKCKEWFDKTFKEESANTASDLESDSSLGLFAVEDDGNDNKSSSTKDGEELSGRLSFIRALTMDTIVCGVFLHKIPVREMF